MVCCHPQPIYIVGVWWKTQEVTYVTNQVPCNMPCPHDRLAQGRYRWRHDIVLRELADTLELEKRKKRNTKKRALQAINVVKEGQTGNKTKAPTT